MNTLINFLPWLLAITAAALYYLRTKSIKALRIQSLASGTILQRRDQRIASLESDLEARRIQRDGLAKEVSGLIGKLNNCVHPEEHERIKGLLTDARFKIDALQSREQVESEKPAHVRLFVDHYEDKRFKNTATINLQSIELRDEELIKEDYIKVIRSLAGKGYFSEEIQSKFGYNAKTGRATFALITLDGEGDPLAFKTWKDFLIERELFAKTVTEYIQQVIGQREINKAVDEALSRKEAVNA